MMNHTELIVVGIFVLLWKVLDRAFSSTSLKNVTKRHTEAEKERDYLLSKLKDIRDEIDSLL